MVTIFRGCRCISAPGSGSVTCRRKPRSSAASPSKTTFARCSRSWSRTAAAARPTSMVCLKSSTSIARALASRPNYMLLDEPFAGIDPIAVGDIQTLVRHLTNRGIGVLITDHNVRETLGLTDRAYIIYSGEVLMEGRTEDIVNDPDVRRLYLGEDFSL